MGGNYWKVGLIGSIELRNFTDWKSMEISVVRSKYFSKSKYGIQKTFF